MRLKIFSVFDKVVEAFLPPFFMVNDKAAIRAVADCVTDPNHMFCKHAENYELHSLGDYEDTSGVISNKVFFVCSLKNLKREIEISGENYEN